MSGLSQLDCVFQPLDNRDKETNGEEENFIEVGVPVGHVSNQKGPRFCLLHRQVYLSTC